MYNSVWKTSTLVGGPDYWTVVMSSTITNHTFPHLNPDTPMAFLRPDVAVHYTIWNSVVAATIGVSKNIVNLFQTTHTKRLMRKAWFIDVFLSNLAEIQIYRKRSFKLPDLMYYLSRVVSGAFLLTAFILSGKRSTSSQDIADQ